MIYALLIHFIIRTGHVDNVCFGFEAEMQYAEFKRSREVNLMSEVTLVFDVTLGRSVINEQTASRSV